MKLDPARLHANMREKFAGELEQLFRPDLGRVAQIAGPEATRRAFRQMMTLSETAGFALQGEIIRYSFVAVHLGLFFDRDPLFKALRDDALWQNPGAHPNVGLNRLFSHADLMIADGLIGGDEGFAPGFLEACQMRQSGPTPVESALAICEEADPKRADALGSEALVHALDQGWRELDLSHAAYRDHPTDWMICSYFLGYGFAHNPLFAWIPEEIAKGGLSRVAKRFLDD